MALSVKLRTHATMLLEFALVLVLVIAGLELGFFSSTLWYLERGPASGSFHFYTGDPDSPFYVLRGTPAHFLLDPGYVAAGAAGVAFVPLGLGGLNAVGCGGHAFLVLVKCCCGLVMDWTAAHAVIHRQPRCPASSAGP